MHGGILLEQVTSISPLFWNFTAVLLKLDVVEEEVEDIPGAAIVTKAANLVFWYILRSIRRAPIWLETLLFPQRNQFLFDNLMVLFQLQDPTELFPRPPPLET
eukprot:CAMPEP_0202960016 /NCGR_PEP_ID=MMETSP1396-20130829/4199_1 /ASSEMBLY_ACC=CAM_ASM_000872 /TAXON_ID= /ORGANISM="Pseudokeronopsis sp., Strain Brazil" /LENGTH=102 /DNA_ID=CAMNT_0049678967 /DNA_START=89 /DNA_END=398 /DNA_ORIENTATION=+